MPRCRTVAVIVAILLSLGGCGDKPGWSGVATEGDEESTDPDASPTDTTTVDEGPKPTVVPGREGMLIVFLDFDATQPAIDAVLRRLEAKVGAGNVRFVDQEEAYAEFSAMFKDRPEVVSKTSPSDLPRSLRVKPKDRAEELAIEDAVDEMEGVKAVVCADRGRCH